jgi:hypothetical protein
MRSRNTVVATYGVPWLSKGTLTTIEWRFADGFSCNTLACGDATTQASISRRTFSGNTQNMALWDPGERDRFGGAYTVSNAQASSPVLIFGADPNPHWYLDLANPHLDVAGSPTAGSFTAWVPPNYFAALGTTAADAVANGFLITRTEDGVETTVVGTAAVENDGAYVRIDSLGYSTPRITVTDDPLGGGTATTSTGASSDGATGSTSDAASTSDAGSSSGAASEGASSTGAAATSAAGSTSGAASTSGAGSTSGGAWTTTEGGSSASTLDPPSTSDAPTTDPQSTGDGGETAATDENTRGCGCNSSTRSTGLLLPIVFLMRRRRRRP